MFKKGYFLILSILILSFAQNKVIYFNANNNNSYAYCDYNSAFFPDNFTIEAWIYPDPWIDGYILCTEDWTGNGAAGYVLRLNPDNGLEFVIGFGNNGWVGINTSKEAIPKLKWTHITATLDNNSMKLYVNGKLCKSKSINSNYQKCSQKLVIGEGTAWTGRRFSGRIFDVRIWDTAKTENEIAELIDSTLTGTENNLIANWKMNENDGADIFDIANSHLMHLNPGAIREEMAPKLASSSSIAIDPQRPNEFLLRVKNTDVKNWTISKNGDFGIASIKQVMGDSLWIIYSTNNFSMTKDQITLEINGFNNTSCTIDLNLFATESVYQLEAEKLMDKISMDFINSEYNFFAETIDSEGNIIADNDGHCYLWPACHILRAYNYAYRVNPEKYASDLNDYIFHLDAYETTKNGRTGYAASQNGGDRYFDDIGWLMDQYYHSNKNLNNDALLERMKVCYNFNHDQRDEFWGIPFKEDMLGIGQFNTVTVAPTALGACYLFKATGDSVYLSDAEIYYGKLVSDEYLVKDKNDDLFHQYSFNVDGTWTYDRQFNGNTLRGRGYRAYQTGPVIQIATELYDITGNEQYLADAQYFAQKSLNHWYSASKGFSEIGFWGGNDMIDALLDLYKVDKDTKWLTASKNIMNRVINYGKDKSGYYAGSYNNEEGFWSLDRRNISPDEVLMMGQATVASALFRLAGIDAELTTDIDKNKEIENSETFFLDQNYPNPFNCSTNFSYSIPVESHIDISIYDIRGTLVEHLLSENKSAGKYSVTWNATNYSSGIYYYQMIYNNESSTRKCLLLK